MGECIGKSSDENRFFDGQDVIAFPQGMQGGNLLLPIDWEKFLTA
jgi:hypothetical protein